MNRGFCLALLTLALFVSGCGDSSDPTAPSVDVPFSATDLVIGNGSQANPGNVVTVNYAGWLYETNAADNKGQQFDASNGFRFTLGSGQVIPGWDQGVVGMREGGSRRLIIPPSLAYGSQGVPGAIPPNATLVFDVELVQVN